MLVAWVENISARIVPTNPYLVSAAIYVYNLNPKSWLCLHLRIDLSNFHISIEYNRSQVCVRVENTMFNTNTTLRQVIARYDYDYVRPNPVI